VAAQKPDGKNPGQRVSFTRQGADRIARAVRTVEAGDRRGQPLRFGVRAQALVSGANITAATATLTTTTITVLTGVVLTTANLTFQRSVIGIVGSTTAASQVIGVYNCPSASISAEGQAFYYG